VTSAKKPFAPRFFFWLGLVVCGWILYSLWPDRGYYVLPAAARPLYAHHALLRSSGRWGLSFGMGGTLLLFLNLTYLVRKRLISIAWLGSLRSWMAFHVFTGLVGGSLVVFHSTLLPRSALGILGFVSVWVVVLTGLVGRYFYAHTPRSLEGRELEIDEIRGRLEGYRAQLAQLGVGGTFFSPLPATTGSSDKSFVGAVLSLMAGDRETRRELSRVRSSVRQSAGLRPHARAIVSLAQRYHTERQWLARYHELRGLMGRWRFLHRWFAIVLLVMAAFHIAVSVRLGNLWFLNGGN
jgi:hypothetical protein